MPVEAKLVPDRDLAGVRRTVERVLERTEGVRDWTTAIDPRTQTVAVTVLVADAATKARLESELASQVPGDRAGRVQGGGEGTVTALHDVCLRVAETEAAPSFAIARRIKSGKTTVTGPGGCRLSDGSGRPRSSRRGLPAGRRERAGHDAGDRS